MLSQTKQSLFWLIAAAVFCGSAVAWKWDILFGSAIDRVSSHSDAATPDAPHRALPLQPRLVTGSDGGDPRTEGSPRFHVTVRDAETGKPIAGARVVWMNRSGSPLSDDVSDAAGVIRTTLCGPGAAHGVAAWHADYKIGARVANSSPVEFELTRVSYLRVELDTTVDAPVDVWLRTAYLAATLEFSRDFNPVKAGVNFLEFKMLDSMRLNDHPWPLRGGDMRIPKYLEGPAKLTLQVRQSLPDHLDKSGLRADRPPESTDHGRTAKTGPVDVARDASDVRVEIPPRSRHGIVAHYSRAEHPRATILLHLSYQESHPGSGSLAKSRGEIVTLRNDFSTYEERDGTATFRIYELEKRAYDPTILIFEPGRERRTIPCNPILVDGHTEVSLSPLQLSGLTVRLAPPDEARTARVLLVDSGMNPILPLPAPTRSGSSLRWPEIPPVEYRILGLSPDGDRASPVHVIRLRPGQDTTLDLALRPARRIALLTETNRKPEVIVLRDLQFGVERVFPRESWETHFVLESRAGGVLRITGRRHELNLAYGTYEIHTTYRGEKTTQELSVDAETETVTLR